MVRQRKTPITPWEVAGIKGKTISVSAIMSLIQSAKMNGHDPYLSLKDLLERLQMHKKDLIYELLPDNWMPQ